MVENATEASRKLEPTCDRSHLSYLCASILTVCFVVHGCHRDRLIKASLGSLGLIRVLLSRERQPERRRI